MGETKRGPRHIEEMTERERLDALWKAYEFILHYRPKEERKETEGEQEKPPEGGS